MLVARSKNGRGVCDVRSRPSAVDCSSKVQRSPHNRIERALVFMAFFFSFTPFFSFYPMASDLQPIFLLPIIVLLLIDWRIGRATYPALFILAVAVVGLFYINPENPLFDFKKSLALFSVYITYLFYVHYAYRLTQRILFCIVLINFCVVLFHYVEPKLFSETLGMFVREVKMLSVSGARGASGFAAEPGFMGALAVFYMSVSYWLKDAKRDDDYHYLILSLSVVIIVLTRSGSGFMFVFIFIFMYYSGLRVGHIFTGAVILLLFVYLSYEFDFGRGGKVIQSIVDDPWRLLTEDASVGQRVINIVVGLLSPLYFPFGLGSGGYGNAFVFLDSVYNISDSIAGLSGNVSAFARLSVELGFFYWGFLSYFIYRSFIGSLGLNALPYLVLALLFHVVSFSVAFPPVWFIFAFMHDKRLYVSRIGYK